MTGERRLRCFLDVDMGTGNVGRIVVELFNDVCPKTCENFRSLCVGDNGHGKLSNRPLNYKGTIFHRVIKGFMIQGGDISSTPGRGGESIYGGLFEDENFECHHDKSFLLSMANRGCNTNGSQFFITTTPAPHLDTRNVVFGQVISGENIVTAIENVPVDRTSRPLTDIKIIRSGELVLSSKTKVKKKKIAKESDHSSTNDSSATSSDDESYSHRKKKRKKRRERSKEKKEVKDKAHPLVSLTPINPDDIPAVPMNRLFRDTAPRNGSERGQSKDRDKFRDRDHRHRDSAHSRDRNQNRVHRDHRDRYTDRYMDRYTDRYSDRYTDRYMDRYMDRSRFFMRGVTKSGRNIKGRGVFRYRTPSRSRSRSATPPHWKQAQSRTIKMAEFQEKSKQQLEWTSQVNRTAKVLPPTSFVDDSSLSNKHREKQDISNNDTNVSSDPNLKKSSDECKVGKKGDAASDLEEGETREDSGQKEDMVSPPLQCSPALDYNALDFEPGLDTQEPVPTVDDLSCTKKWESWDTKRQPHFRSKEKPEGDGTQCSPNVTENSVNDHCTSPNQKASLIKSHDAVLPGGEGDTPSAQISSDNKVVGNDKQNSNPDVKDEHWTEKHKDRREREHKRRPEKKQCQDNSEEGTKRKRGSETEHKLVQQKKVEKSRDVEKRKGHAEGVRKDTSDSSRKHRRRSQSGSSSSSRASPFHLSHKSKHHSRRNEDNRRRSHSPSRKSKSPGRYRKSRNRH